MTTSVAVDRVRILLDKYSTPYFTDDEVLAFLNMAQLERLRRLVPLTPLEFDYNNYADVQPLVRNGVSNLDAGNAISQAALLTALRDSSGDVTATYYRIIALRFNPDASTSIPVKYTRFNNIGTNLSNTFKQPSATNLLYTIDAAGIIVYTGGAEIVVPGSAFVITFIRNPATMTLISSPEWDDANMGIIIEIAAQYGATATRDQDFQQVNNSTSISK